MILCAQTESAFAQKKNDNLPTVKREKRKREPVRAKVNKKPEKVRNSYQKPKTVSSSAKAKDTYKRPKTSSKAEKQKDNYKQPSTKTVNFSNRKVKSFSASSSREEGGTKVKPTLFQKIRSRNNPALHQGHVSQKNKHKKVSSGTTHVGGAAVKKINRGKLSEDIHLYEGSKKVGRSRQKADQATVFEGRHRQLKPVKKEKLKQKQSSSVGLHQRQKKISKPQAVARKEQKKADKLQHQGQIRVKKPMAQEKHDRREAASLQYKGHIKMPTLNARTRTHKKLSEKVHQYEGNLRYLRPGKDMHPSVYHLKAKTKNSYEQKEDYRRLRLKISHIFKASDQPKHLKEKNRKPRYDKDESKIWYY